jgi:flagellar motor switch/type III secretory pathway protein FliN
MATTQSLPNQGSEPLSETTRNSETVEEQALMPSSLLAREGAMVLTPAIAQLPVELDVAVPVRNFRVRNLLTLDPGQVIETTWLHGTDMPLCAGNVQLAWSEFEVVDLQLAVRVTRLA